ncbi:MAG: winged helix-turn-helix domain-containing protein [Candidatus Hodarchaeota archaeon]
MEGINIPLIRAAFIIRQGLDEKPSWKSVRETIQQIAAVQIDSISVVARSHHLTLRHRVRNYHPDQVWTALRNNEVFEHFAHGCCFVPIEEYPYYRHRMERFSIHCNGWQKSRLIKYKKLMDAVEQRVRDEGPLSSKDFEDPTATRRGGFWDWKPAKHALDLLWETGRLAVTERRGFQRYYDISERVIPSKYLDQHIDPEMVWRYFIERNLDSLVACTAKGLCEYISCSNFALNISKNRTKTMEKQLEILIQEDIVTKITVPSVKNQYYMLTRQLPFLERVQDRSNSSSTAWFLNPFDNILWNRPRVKELFGIELKLEAYTPPSQRQFGYYVTPILWQHRVIGRLDPKANRETSTLILRNFEVFLPSKEIPKVVEPIREELHRFQTFHDLTTVKIEHATPSRLKSQFEG